MLIITESWWQYKSVISILDFGLLIMIKSNEYQGIPKQDTDLFTCLLGNLSLDLFPQTWTNQLMRMYSFLLHLPILIHFHINMDSVQQKRIPNLLRNMYGNRGVSYLDSFFVYRQPTLSFHFPPSIIFWLLSRFWCCLQKIYLILHAKLFWIFQFIFAAIPAHYS